MCHDTNTDTEYSFHLHANFSNVIFRATTRLCRVKSYFRIVRIYVMLSVYVKTTAYRGMVIKKETSSKMYTPF